MSYPINQKVNPYSQPAMGVNANPLPGVDGDKIRQGINDSPVTKATKQDNPMLLLGTMVPAFGFVYWSMNKFSKACQDNYDKTILGKIGNFGDKIGNSKLFKNAFVEGLTKKTQWLKNTLKDKVIPKSKILSAVFNTPSKPTHHMVLTMYNGITAEIGSSATQLFEKFTKNGEDLEKVKSLGFTKTVEGKVVADVDKYKDIVKNSHKYTDEIIKACETQGSNSFTAARAGKIPLLKDKYITEILPFTKKIFCPEHKFSEFVNKMQAAKGLQNTAHTTAIGKTLPKQTLRIIEGLTNASTGGGLIGALMGSYIIADSIIKSIKAPKGEKGKTFSENMLYNLGFYLTMPFALRIMHGAGGLQYIGMSKEKVEEYRNKLEIHNEKAKAETFANKEEWKSSKTALKDALKGDTKILKTDSAGTRVLKFAKNIIYKPLKWAGRVITVGLESIKPYTSKNASGMEKASQLFGKFKFKLKDIAGYPMRLGLFLFVIAPPLAKLFAKGSHLVFGKPTHSVLDEGKEDKEKEKQLQMQQPVQSPVMPMQPAKRTNLMMDSEPKKMNLNQASYAPGGNLVDMYKKDNTNKTMVSKPQEPVRTYIPSPVGVVVPEDPKEQNKDKKLNDMLGKADIAEKVANRYAH